MKCWQEQRHDFPVITLHLFNVFLYYITLNWIIVCTQQGVLYLHMKNTFTFIQYVHHLMQYQDFFVATNKLIICILKHSNVIKMSYMHAQN